MLDIFSALKQGTYVLWCEVRKGKHVELVHNAWIWYIQKSSSERCLPTIKFGKALCSIIAALHVRIHM